MIEPGTIKIDNLMYGGDAVGRLADGRAVFVPYAIPGEVVRIKLVEEKPRFARAELIEVLEPSPQRFPARCPHFTQCGGCHYQHMNYSAQLGAKSAILCDQLKRIGYLSNIPPVEIVASPEPWNYRNHIQFHLSADGKLGFKKNHSNQTLAIRECHLPDPAINQVWPQVDIEPLPGLERISLRSGSDEDLMLILESTDSPPLDFSIEDLAISMIHQTPLGSLVLAGSDHIFIEVLGRRFQVSAGSFFQVNSFLVNTMAERILSSLPLEGAVEVLDVYCGVGLFSATLAPKVERVVGIEISQDACTDFAINLDEFEHVSLYEDSAEAVLSKMRFHPDVMVVDPPRQGLGAKTLEGILAQEASHLVYVSCDPATLARDARQLVSGGYKLVKLALVDMFPQTFHIESISNWERT
jgi:23S rRNA (uracil1939-C5)-methyltransferase